MRRTLLALLAPLALTALVAACGGGDDDGGASDDATDVECLPASTVSEVTGMTMGEPEPSDVPTLYLQCLYTAEDGIHGVQTLEYYASDDIQAQVDIFTDVVDDEVEVDLGDQAYWSASITKLLVVHGQRAAEVSVSYFDPPEYDPQALATDIALAILR